MWVSSAMPADSPAHRNKGGGLFPLQLALSLTSASGQGVGQDEDRLGWCPNHCNLIGHEEEVGLSSQCPAVSQMGLFSPQLPLVATAQKEQEVADSFGSLRT